jgi:sugar-specific transcriptional regulator TrmB
MSDFDYDEWVNDCYQSRKNQEIHNASQENALMIFNKLFDKAIRDKEDIKIITNKLLASFYNQLTDKLKQIVENGNTVQVIVEEKIDDQENNNFYHQSKRFLKKASSFEGLPNFIIVGNNSFRYSADKKDTKAIANFNDESMGSFLLDLFDKIDAQIVQ